MLSRQPVEIRTSPHLKQAQSVEDIMRNVVYALLPVCAWAVWQFGWLVRWQSLCWRSGAGMACAGEHMRRTALKSAPC